MIEELKKIKACIDALYIFIDDIDVDLQGEITKILASDDVEGSVKKMGELTHFLLSKAMAKADAISNIISYTILKGQGKF